MLFSSCLAAGGGLTKSGQNSFCPQINVLKKPPLEGRLWDIDLCQTKLHGWEPAAPLCFTEKLL